MRFRDPLTCQCPICDKESTLPVRQLLDLSAICPSCGATLKDVGLNMRGMIDETAAFFNSVTLIVYLENHLGITISDETVEAIRSWDELTLNDLATAVIRSDSSIPPSVIDNVLRSAVRKEFPDAPDPLDFNALLLDAIAKPRKYGGY